MIKLTCINKIYRIYKNETVTLENINIEGNKSGGMI